MEQYILFESNSERIAIDIFYIERIIEYVKPKQIPESSKYLLGVIQYNGQVIPVIDFTLKLYDLSRDENNEDAMIIIVEWNKKQVGFVVDNIIGIEHFDEKQYVESKESSEMIKEYIKGFIKSEKDTDEDIIIVLDVDKLFTMEQSKELEEASHYN